MRLLPLSALLPVVLCAAPGLELVRPAISQTDGGPIAPAAYEYTAGETLYFSCRVSGYTKNPEERIQLGFTVQAFDAKDVPVAEIYKGEFTSEVLPQDKDWMPKIEVGVSLPPLVRPGNFRIMVKTDDLIAKTSASLTVPFRVRGRDVEPTERLAVRNFRFVRGEEENAPVVTGAFKTGDTLNARFDITGYQFGPGNQIDVSYVVSVLGTSGKTLWTQPEPALEKSASFYPKPWVPASLQLGLETVKPGAYSMKVVAKDAIGNQTGEITQPFTVE
jgi:hypothetical protein